MAENARTFIFQGIDDVTYTQVPDVFFDFLMPRLTGAELKVLLYVARRTFGFKKKRDDISFSQICSGITTREGKVLDEGTGLSKSTAQIAVKGLLSKEVIVANKRSSRERGNEPTTYSLKFRKVVPDGPYTGNRHRGMPEIGTALYRKSATQETVVQQTVLSNDVNVERTPKNTHTDEDVAKLAYLAEEVAKRLGDDNKRSLATFKRIIEAIGEPATFHLLGNTKEAYEDDRVSYSKRAAYFMGMVKNYASDNGIELNFKAGKPQNGKALADKTTVEIIKAQIGNPRVIGRYRSEI